MIAHALLRGQDEQRVALVVMMGAAAVLNRGDPQSLPHFYARSLPPRADGHPIVLNRLTSSGRTFLIESQLVCFTRTVHVDFLRLEHAQTEHQVPNQTRMAVM
jgi:hypothetical protein